MLQQFNRWPQELKRALQSGQPPAQQAGGAEKNASPRNQLQQVSLLLVCMMQTCFLHFGIGAGAPERKEEISKRCFITA